MGVPDPFDRRKTKKDLEDKIAELEIKLSQLSNNLNKDDDEPDHKRSNWSDYDRVKAARESELERLARELDADGSASRQLLRIAEENYTRDLQRRAGLARGTLPKGFTKVSKADHRITSGTLPKGFGSSRKPSKPRLSKGQKLLLKLGLAKVQEKKKK